MVLELNKENFEKEVEKSDIPVVVDFWASWCMPCQMMGPIFEKVSKEFEGKLKFAKLSTEEHQELAQKYNIMSIPCLVVYKDGKEAARITGLRHEGQLKEDLNEILGKLSA